MEYTIDRKAYRRNSYNESYERREKTEIIKGSNNLFLNKIINSMLLLLFVLLLKLFYFEDEFNVLKENFNSGYSYEFIKTNVNKKITKIINKEEINLIFEDEKKEVRGDNIEGETSSVSGEMNYIEAVEGVNQLLDDAIIIKENYKITKPLEGTITSNFGCRESDNPIISTYHKGLDIAANSGTNIVAAHSGTVIQAGENGTYGKCIIIESGDLKTLYAHCSNIAKEEGDVVDLGEVIGKVGMTGNATGPHLHFEIIYQERYVNPEDVI